MSFPGAGTLRQKLRSFFEKTPVIHYIKQHETVVIGEIIVDVKNILLRPYACDGSHCLSMQSLPNHLEGYGFTFYNEVAACGDCCRGPIVFISQAERQMLGIPYTGSGPLSLALCLHKGKTKQVLSWHGIPTPVFQVLTHPDEPLSAALTFPLIVKLLHEGSSMGLSYNSVVETRPALVERMTHLMHTYAQPVLVEQFIDGREFTVALLGNTPPRPLPVIEVQFQGPRHITLFQPDDEVIRMLAGVRGQRLATPLAFQLSADHERALVRTEDGGVVEIPVALTASVCPAAIPTALTAALQDTALRAFRALECRDWCRVDMRVGVDGIPQVLELNPIAGLDPTCWFPRSARAAGMDYPTLMRTLVDIACRRYGL